MQYVHLTGRAEARLSDDVPTDCYLIKWQKWQLPLSLWWHQRGERSRAPELILIYEFSVEKVVCTYKCPNDHVIRACMSGRLLDKRETEFSTRSSRTPLGVKLGFRRSMLFEAKANIQR